MITASLRRLDTGDAAPLTRLLDEEPLHTVYLRSELRLAGAGAGQWWGVEADGRIRGALLGGPLVFPWAPHDEDVERLAESLRRQAAPRMMVGPSRQVLALHQARRPAPPPLRETRNPQPLLALHRQSLPVRPARQVRLGTPADLERLTLAAADMHREEMGIDPLAVDPSGWRSRMATLIQRRWSWVWTEGDEVVFKAELSAWTPEAVQIQGVYTAPRHRNRGIATAAMATVCAAVLEQAPVCTLYVNHYNLAARAVYRRLGFEHIGDMATLMY